MQLVENYSLIVDSYTFVKSFKKKSITNFFLQKESCEELINKKQLFHYKIGETIFLIKKGLSHSNLYFYASSVYDLEYSLTELQKQTNNNTIVSDIVTKNTDCEIVNAFKKAGFFLYTSLVRMSALTKPFTTIDAELQDYLKEANEQHIDVINELLNTYFDPLAEQLPSKDNILKWVLNKNILIYEINCQVAGFIIYEINGNTLYLRYWFVHPDFRDKKIGSKLFNYFLFKGQSTFRRIFWVIRSNENAIKRYKHYGFFEENMFNFVMINKDKRYEG